LATIREVARLAGVSVATVSYVFSGARSVRPATEARVREAAERLGYLPNAAARALTTKSGQILAALVSDVGNPFFAPVLRAIEARAREAGYMVVIADTHEDATHEEDYLRRLALHYVDGLIVSPSSEQRATALLKTHWDGRIVVINRRLPGVDADFVATDNRLGARQLTNYLLDRGHSSVGIVAGSQELSTHRERYEGYREALVDRGFPIDEQLVRRVGTTTASAYEAARELFRFRGDERPTALFVTSGIHATGAYQAVLELGLRIPQDLSFVAFDRADWMTLVSPPITTIQQPTEAIGRLSAELLIERLTLHMAGETRAARQFLLEPVLHEGGSVATVRHAGEGGGPVVPAGDASIATSMSILEERR
jgi:LacI family transcriptional regulator